MTRSRTMGSVASGAIACARVSACRTRTAPLQSGLKTKLLEHASAHHVEGRKRLGCSVIRHLLVGGPCGAARQGQ